MKEPLKKYIETRLGSGFLLIACGLPSTGKTGATNLVAEFTGYPVLRTDSIRRELLKGEDIFDEAVASNMDKRTMVYEEMFRRAAEVLLATGNGLVLDATFVTQSLRKRAAGLANRHGKALIILETVCPEDVALKRIRERTIDAGSNALTAQAYFSNKRIFEKVDLDDLKGSFPTLPITHLVVDTARPFPAWYVVKDEKRE
ncbi:MAG: ATP-binding protein [Chloroflexi bacterium]|nr:ATP-binding protein [Chloroflexota bacterium]